MGKFTRALGRGFKGASRGALQGAQLVAFMQDFEATQEDMQAKRERRAREKAYREYIKTAFDETPAFNADQEVQTGEANQVMRTDQTPGVSIDDPEEKGSNVLGRIMLGGAKQGILAATNPQQALMQYMESQAEFKHQQTVKGEARKLSKTIEGLDVAAYDPIDIQNVQAMLQTGDLKSASSLISRLETTAEKQRKARGRTVSRTPQQQSLEAALGRVETTIRQIENVKKDPLSQYLALKDPNYRQMLTQAQDPKRIQDLKDQRKRLVAELKKTGVDVSAILKPEGTGKYTILSVE